jgi:hypothetical protein
MMSGEVNPYRIDGPAIISFSMGRSSAFMLWSILDAYDGKLPDDVHVVTTNTGKERWESLRFGHECATRWVFDWHLIEYRNDDLGFERVGLNSASMDGEPFAALIEKKGYVPNRGAPFCSVELKARTTRDYVRATWGWQNWSTALGIRHDEKLRTLGAIGRNQSGKDPWRNILPMDTAKATKRDVMSFWLGADWRRRIHDRLAADPSLPRGFDLGLLDYEGNCKRCFKKHEPKIRRIIRDEQQGRIAHDPWWSEQEQRTGSTFGLVLSHADLERQVRDEPMFELPDGDDEGDEECGFTCAISDADQSDLAA